MNDDAPYRPIDCSIHDTLESLATLRRRCTIVYHGTGDEILSVDAVIVDVYTEGAAEYIRTEDGLVIRLDRLTTVDGRRVGPAC